MAGPARDREAAVRLLVEEEGMPLHSSVGKKVEDVERKPLALVYDLDALDEGFRAARAAFADNFAHAVACKTNPLCGTLSRAREAGMWCETASVGEVKMALKAGFEPSHVVFDSPAKTLAELRLSWSRDHAECRQP